MHAPDGQGRFTIKQAIDNCSGDQLFRAYLNAFEDLRRAVQVGQILLDRLEAEVFVLGDGYGLGHAAGVTVVDCGGNVFVGPTTNP